MKLLTVCARNDVNFFKIHSRVCDPLTISKGTQLIYFEVKRNPNLGSVYKHEVYIFIFDRIYWVTYSSWIDVILPATFEGLSWWDEKRKTDVLAQEAHLWWLKFFVNINKYKNQPFRQL